MGRIAFDLLQRKKPESFRPTLGIEGEVGHARHHSGKGSTRLIVTESEYRDQGDLHQRKHTQCLHDVVCLMVCVSDIPESQIEFSAIRASGPGGQNVNKVSTAIHLRFDVKASSLPEAVKSKLLELRDARINTDGVIVIKAQKFRSQEKNKVESLERLDELLQKSQFTEKPRRKTRPSRSSVRKRLDSKKKQGSIKKNRGKVDDY